MKKKFLAFLTSICMMLLCFAPISAYAMETEELPDTVSNEKVISRAGVERLEYGVSKDIIGGQPFVFTNTNLTPTKYTANDARVHRLIVKVRAKSVSGTPGLKLYIVINGKKTVINKDGLLLNPNIPSLITNNPGDAGTYGCYNVEILVGANQAFQVYFEAGNSTQSIIVTQFELYCD